MSRKEEAIRHVVGSGDYRPDFPGWLFEHWGAFRQFEQLALDGVRRGRRRLSSKFMIELIRWNMPAIHEEVKGTQRDPYKLNNVFTPDLARLATHMNPDLKGKFELRRRIGVAA